MKEEKKGMSEKEYQESNDKRASKVIEEARKEWKSKSSQSKNKGSKTERS